MQGPSGKFLWPHRLILRNRCWPQWLSQEEPWRAFECCWSLLMPSGSMHAMLNAQRVSCPASGVTAHAHIQIGRRRAHPVNALNKSRALRKTSTTTCLRDHATSHLVVRRKTTPSSVEASPEVLIVQTEIKNASGVGSSPSSQRGQRCYFLSH